MKKKPGPPKRSGSTVTAASPGVAAEREVNPSKCSTRDTCQDAYYVFLRYNFLLHCKFSSECQ